MDPHEVLGTMDSFSLFETGKGFHYTRKGVSARPITITWQNLARQAFHGGRSECFYFGATAVDAWIDVDLKGAYSTALASIGMPDYDNIFTGLIFGIETDDANWFV